METRLILPSAKSEVASWESRESISLLPHERQQLYVRGAAMHGSTLEWRGRCCGIDRGGFSSGCVKVAVHVVCLLGRLLLSYIESVTIQIISYYWRKTYNSYPSIGGKRIRGILFWTFWEWGGYKKEGARIYDIDQIMCQNESALFQHSRYIASMYE